MRLPSLPIFLLVTIVGCTKAESASEFAATDAAMVRGVYTMTMTPPGATTSLSEDGNYLIHWRRSDGHWMRVSQFASSPNPIPPPPRPK